MPAISALRRLRQGYHWVQGQVEPRSQAHSPNREGLDRFISVVHCPSKLAQDPGFRAHCFRWHQDSRERYFFFFFLKIWALKEDILQLQPSTEKPLQFSCQFCWNWHGQKRMEWWQGAWEFRGEESIEGDFPTCFGCLYWSEARGTKAKRFGIWGNCQEGKEVNNGKSAETSQNEYLPYLTVWQIVSAYLRRWLHFSFQRITVENHTNISIWNWAVSLPKQSLIRVSEISSSAQCPALSRGRDSWVHWVTAPSPGSDKIWKAVLLCQSDNKGSQVTSSANFFAEREV